MVDLGTLPDGVESYVAAVNDSGQVVGGAAMPTTILTPSLGHPPAES